MSIENMRNMTIIVADEARIRMLGVFLVSGSKCRRIVASFASISCAIFLALDVDQTISLVLVADALTPVAAAAATSL